MNGPTQSESVTWHISTTYLDINPFIWRQGISSHAMIMDIGEEDWVFKEGAVVGGAR